MESQNIKHVPLNREGALELGMCPCDICDVSWAIYTENKETKYCRNECDYFKRYIEKIKSSRFFEYVLEKL